MWCLCSMVRLFARHTVHVLCSHALCGVPPESSHSEPLPSNVLQPFIQSTRVSSVDTSHSSGSRFDLAKHSPNTSPSICPPTTPKDRNHRLRSHSPRFTVSAATIPSRLPRDVKLWKKRHISIWLTQIELQEYASSFAAASVDGGE